MHVHTFMYIVAKYEITKFTSNRGQCAYYTTKRPPTKTQSLPQWHFYGFALCRQVDGLSAGDWQLGVVRRLFPSHAADSCWRFCSGHHSRTVTPVFSVAKSIMDDPRSGVHNVLVNPWIYMYRFMVIRMDVSEKALYPRWLWCLRSDQMRTKIILNISDRPKHSYELSHLVNIRIHVNNF